MAKDKNGYEINASSFFNATGSGQKIKVAKQKSSYYNSDGPAELQNKLIDAQNTLKDLQDKLAKSSARLADWTNLCNKQKCDTTAKNIISEESANVASYTQQISTQNGIVDSLKSSLAAANKVVVDPQLQSAKSAADTAAAAAALKKTRTIWIASIAGVAVVLGGIFLIVKVKRKKSA